MKFWSLNKLPPGSIRSIFPGVMFHALVEFVPVDKLKDLGEYILAGYLLAFYYVVFHLFQTFDQH